MKNTNLLPLAINWCPHGEVELIQQPLAQGQAPARIRITLEMIPAVTKALSHYEKAGLIKDCRDVLDGEQA